MSAAVHCTKQRLSDGHACSVFISARRLPTDVESAPQASTVLRRPIARPVHLRQLCHPSNTTHVLTRKQQPSVLQDPPLRARV